MSEYGKTESIGGGVYAQPMPGGGVTIMANHHEHPTDRVWLDGYAVKSLIELLGRVKASELCVKSDGGDSEQN